MKQERSIVTTYALKALILRILNNIEKAAVVLIAKKINYAHELLTFNGVYLLAEISIDIGVTGEVVIEPGAAEV